MSENREVNCIGYVSMRLGNTDSEQFIPLPKLEHVLDLFDTVPDISTAKVIAVVDKSTGKHNGTKPTVCHMAIVEEDGRISHRREFGGEVTCESFMEGLYYYADRPWNYKIIYLIPKTDIYSHNSGLQPSLFSIDPSNQIFRLGKL